MRFKVSRSFSCSLSKIIHPMCGVIVAVKLSVEYRELSESDETSFEWSRLLVGWSDRGHGNGSRRCLAVYGELTGGGLFERTNKHMHTNTNKPTQPPLAFFSVIRCQRTALWETLTYFYQLSLGAGRTWKSSRFLPLPVYDRKEGPDSNFSDNTALKGRRGYVLTFIFFHSFFLPW